MSVLRKRLIVASVLLLFTGWLTLPFGPSQSVVALTHLTDPAKLATLGERAANPRLNKTVYWLNRAQHRGLPPGIAIDIAQFCNRTHEPRASLTKASLLRNLKIAGELGLLTSENQDRLRHGHAGIVERGPYSGSKVEVDHIVPLSLAPEAGNELANLELMPEALNRRKSNRVGSRQLAHAEKLLAARLISQDSFERIKARTQAVEITP